MNIKKSEDKVKIKCPNCDKEMTPKNLGRHIKDFHAGFFQ